MSEKGRHISRGDYARALLTECLPHETPIIFSNEGLYDRAKRAAELRPLEKVLFNSLVLGKDLPGRTPSV